MATPAASTTTPAGIPPAALTRLIDEGHTPTAWFGTDLLTAVAAVDAGLAARRPGPGRHNIGEIALHHAYWTREVRGRLTGGPLEPFPFDGEDWFAWPAPAAPGWDEIRELLAAEVRHLRNVVSDIQTGALRSPLSPEQQFEQVLGIAGHAAYHAGQVQLVRRLLEK